MAQSPPWVKSNRSASSSGRQSSMSRSSPDACVKTKDRFPAASVACEQPMGPGEKHVSFAGVTVIEYPRWIDQTEHVCSPPPRGGPVSLSPSLQWPHLYLLIIPRSGHRGPSERPIAGYSSCRPMCVGLDFQVPAALPIRLHGRAVPVIARQELRIGFPLAFVLLMRYW